MEKKQPGYFIAIEGIDGSGKSTLAPYVVSALQNAEIDICFCTGKQIPDSPAFAVDIMNQMRSLLWPKANTYFDHLLPPQYWIHLQATWYSLSTEFLIKAKLKDRVILIVDGWIYKFLAKLLVRGFSPEVLQIIYSHVIQPDHVFLLQMNIEDIWERKKDFKPHEMGLHHYAEQDLGKRSFMDYQTNVFTALKTLSCQQNWSTVELDAYAPVEQSVEVLANQIKRLPFLQEYFP